MLRRDSHAAFYQLMSGVNTEQVTAKHVRLGSWAQPRGWAATTR